MAWGSSSGTVANAAASASSASYTSGAITCPIGDQIFLWVAFDNLTATTPTISSITKAGGESASWVQIAAGDSPAAGAGAGTRGELWAITPAVTWTAFSPVVTLSGAVTAKASVGIVKSGGTLNARETLPKAGSNTTTASPSTNITTPLSGDLVIGLLTKETQTGVVTPDADTTLGSWSAAIESANGSGAAADVLAYMQWKITSGAGTQTFNPTTATATDGTVAVIALAPASDPTTARVSRVHEDALLLPTADARVSRVHADALLLPTADGRVSRVHLDALVQEATFSGTATGANTSGGTADGTYGRTSDATGANTQGATADGSLGLSGGATGAHTSGASSDGDVVPGFAGLATGSHTQGATATGSMAADGTATGAHTQTGTATGATGLSSAATAAHTQGATADSTVTADPASGATAAHTSSATADGALGAGNVRTGTPLDAEHTQGAIAVGEVTVELPAAGTGTIRWLFLDPLTSDSYTVEINPDSMTSPEPPQKALRTAQGLARDNADPVHPRTVTLLTPPPPWDWEFSGAIRTQEHYTALRDWVAYTTPVFVRDHLTRVFEVYFTDFVPVEYPKASRLPWRMRYTVKAKILRRVS